MKDVIGNLPSTQVLTQCLTAGQFCNLITRDSQGTLWLQPNGRIQATNINLSRLETKGIDFGVNYSMKFSDGWGALNVNFVGTLLKNYIAEPIPGLGSFDCKGLYGPNCGTTQGGLPALPEWRHKLRGTWSTPWNVDMSLTWRHISELSLSTTSSNPLLHGPAAPVQDKFAAREYFDIAANWNVTKQLTIRGGINNLFDKDPPLSTLVGAGFGNGNTYPQLYDSLGRRVFLNATYKF